MPSPSPADLDRFRIQRALRGRTRYRYVRPFVTAEGQGYRVVSPCCSRRVDPGGGLIDIGWLERGQDGLWRLYARDHARQRWDEQASSRHLDELLDLLCQDPLHRFWV